MKLAVLDTAQTEVKKIDMPVQFSEEIRPDLVKRAVETVDANARQKYGAKPDAGMRHVSWISRRRHDYKGSYGHGISRVPRKILSRRGTHFNWQAATAPGTVGGRRAHPPKASKNWEKKLNKKERRKAIRSALAATLYKELVQGRGHKAPQQFPFIVSSDFEQLKTTKQIKDSLAKLGFSEELKRVEEKTIRAGRGTARGRKYKKKVGPLLVVSQKESAACKAAQNISGVECVSVEALNAKLLAPGAHIGRLTLFTEAAVQKIGNDKLFTDYVVKKTKEGTKQ